MVLWMRSGGSKFKYDFTCLELIQQIVLMLEKTTVLKKIINNLLDHDEWSRSNVCGMELW